MNVAASFSTHALAEAYALAARTVASVLEGHGLNEALAAQPESGRLRAAGQDLTYRTLRAHGRVDALADALLERTPHDRRLYALLLVALCELDAQSAASHTVVDQAVEAALLLGLARGKGLINAVLRAYGRRREELERELSARPTYLFQHPGWWIERGRSAYPDHWQGLLEQGNTHPPMGLRVNRRHGSTEAYLDRLAQAGAAATRVGEAALVLERAVPVAELPGFLEGNISVQDAGAQLAAPLMDVHDGMTVLDACAAPGGKTGHLLELADCALTALDNSESRTARVRDNLRRLGLAADVRKGDALEAEAVLGKRRFQRILLDAPCSASGVVRRHPDAKWLRRPGDVARFAQLQDRLLEALWRLLEPDGKLLYATCSVFPEENGEVVDRFLGRHDDARRLPVPFTAAGAPDGQMLPTATSDGFYYALMSKNP